MDARYADEALAGDEWESDLLKERAVYEASRRKSLRKKQEKGPISWVKKKKKKSTSGEESECSCRTENKSN